MPDVFEAARSGRASCRGCGRKIEKGAVRFGERLPNPFGDGEATYWFHVDCAAWMRPEKLLEALASAPSDVCIPGGDRLRAIAEVGAAHRRLPRLRHAERASSGRARCRSCGALIEKGAWRLALGMFQDGRFDPIGMIHVACSENYFETRDILERIVALSPDLTDADRNELGAALEAEPPVRLTLESAERRLR